MARMEERLPRAYQSLTKAALEIDHRIIPPALLKPSINSLRQRGALV